MPRTKLWLIAALIVIATVLFVVGVAIERGGGHQETGEAHTEEVGEVHSEEAGEAHSEEAGEVHSETIFGLNLESPWLVGAAALVSLMLVGALLYFGHPALMIAIPIMAVMMLLDIMELIRQVSEANLGIAAIAAVIVLMRLAIIVLAIQALREGRLSLPQAGTGSSQSII